MKQEISPMEYASHILQALPKGILLTTRAEGRDDTMVIGWGHMGILWGKPVFIVYVRESRFTKTLLDKNPEFTVNVPLDAVDPQVIAVCGRQSGRDVDKFALCGLTREPGRSVSVPAIRELPLTLECKVIYSQRQERNAIGQEVLDRYYAPTEADPEGDIHTAYYGLIVDSYIVKEA